MSEPRLDLNTSELPIKTPKMARDVESEADCQQSLSSDASSHAMSTPSAYRSATSSPESRPADCQESIPEEDEDETSSEAIEPLTPTSDTHPHTFDHIGRSTSSKGIELPHPAPQSQTQPIFINTPATPTSSPNHPTKPSSPPETPSISPSSTMPTPTTPGTKRATSTRIRSFFRRTTSYGPARTQQTSTETYTSITQEFDVPQQRRPSSFSLYSRTSNRTSNSNTPPSPSPTNTLNEAGVLESNSAPTPGIHHANTDLLSSGQSRVTFRSVLQPERPERHRSLSMNGLPKVQIENPLSLHAETGVGAKARRMSTCLPDDFFVDVIELNTEFSSTSLLPGRRGKTVGTGATANVKLMCKKGGPSDEVYAVKEFRKKSKQEDEAEYVKKVKSEYTIAKSLSHPNIVKTVRLCTHNGRWNHVMEYCSQGELYSLVQKSYMDESDRLCFFKQLIRGVAYLHEHGIAHRDIKLENLLITNEGYLKITDFGVSEVFCGEHPGLRNGGGECGKNMKDVRLSTPGICGSLPYIAPEVLAKKGKYDPRALDVWSSAIVYLSMRFGGNPWPAAETSYLQYSKFIKGWEHFFEKHPDHICDETSGTPRCGELFQFLEGQAIRKLILRMMHPDPSKRISIEQALKDRWVKGIECCSPEPNHTIQNGKFDVACKNSCRLACKKVQKVHNHLPPNRRMEVLHPTF